MLRRETPVVGAGRTDAGVHARLMVAHFDSPEQIDDLEQLVFKLNRILPKDIAINRIVAVVPEAHARFDAVSRTYKYYISTQKDPFNFDFAYQSPGLLDFDAMNRACHVLFEYTDFTSFSKLHTDAKTNLCLIKEAGWELENGLWVFTISANRFLRNMVRAIVGTMLEIGRGKLTPDGLRKVIEAKDRGRAGMSVPGHALFLVDVTYPEHLFLHKTDLCG